MQRMRFVSCECETGLHDHRFHFSNDNIILNAISSNSPGTSGFLVPWPACPGQPATGSPHSSASEPQLPPQSHGLPGAGAEPPVAASPRCAAVPCPC